MLCQSGEPGGTCGCNVVMVALPTLTLGQPELGTGPGTRDAFAKALRLWGTRVSPTGSPPAHGQGCARARGRCGERLRPSIRMHRVLRVEAVAKVSLRCHWDTGAAARPQIYSHCFWLKTD